MKLFISISKTLVYFLNPIVIPLLCFVLIFYNFNYRFIDIPTKIWNITILIFTLMTSIFPLIILYILKKLNIAEINNLDVQKRRIIPHLIFLFFYLMAYMIFKPKEVTSIFFMEDILLSTFLLSSTLSIGISFFVNNFKTLSLHTISASNLFFYFVFLHKSTSNSLLLTTFLSLMILILISSTRILLGNYNQKTISYSILVSFISQLLAFAFFFK